jgi:hypothetical protein
MTAPFIVSAQELPVGQVVEEEDSDTYNPDP